MFDAATNYGKKFLGDTTKLVAPRVYQSGGKKSMGQMSSSIKTKIAKAPVEKASVEKSASVFGTTPTGIVNAVRPSAGSMLAAAGMLAGATVASDLLGSFSTAVRKAIDSKAYAGTLDKAVEINPKLKAYDRALLKNYYNLIAESSPTVARNPLLVSNYLQYMLDHEGSMNFMAYKGLVDMEGQMLKNQEATNPAQSTAQKALIENVLRMSIPQVQYKVDVESRR